MKKYDVQFAVAFSLLLLALFVAAATNDSFFHWAYARHQNTVSWYIRPLFFIPFCFFAYKRSWAGIAGTVLLLFTSMFWFPEPAVVDDNVKGFLLFEKEWLGSDWTAARIFQSSLVPLSFFVLGLAFWKRSLWIGLSVIVLIAIGKMTWSVMSAGAAGKSVIVPATIGMLVCCVLVYYGFRRMEHKARK